MVSIGAYSIQFIVLRMSRPEAVTILLLLVTVLLQQDSQRTIKDSFLIPPNYVQIIFCMLKKGGGD
jgi:hypothetical protein